MLKIQTAEADFSTLDPEQNEWVYNSLDCAVTAEVWNNITSQVQDFTIPTYNFVQGMQAPALCMALRGIRIDPEKRGRWTRDLELRVAKLEGYLNQMSAAVWDKPLNPASSKQLIDFFYGVMRIPAETKWDKVKKQKTVSADRKALEKVRNYFHARPIVDNILRQREHLKKISTLKTGIDQDAPGHFRMRTSYNVCGTETGRWSSNENAFGTGTNLQNWTNELREIFIADSEATCGVDMKMAYIDLEQAESRVVAYLSGDQNYIDACESGDLHTAVARMVWKNLPWTGVLKHDKEVAAQKVYRDFSARDLAKRLGHGTNYRGKPRTMAMHTNMDTRAIEEFQALYFAAFPGIAEWHQEVAYLLQTQGFLTTPLGRTRYFLGRLSDDDTLKEAIAFLPQSTIGEILNEGMYRMWDRYDNKRDQTLWMQLLAQVHDATLIQYPDLGYDFERELFGELQTTLQIPIPVNGRQLIIPAKVEGTGWNWRKYDSRKPAEATYGLMEWKGKDDRKRPQENTSKFAGVYL